MYCQHCGEEIDDQAIICVKCGVLVTGRSLNRQEGATVSDEWLITLVLCFFLGCFGMHNFYTRNTTTGIVQLVLGVCTCCIVSEVWSIVDFLRILNGTFTTGEGDVLKQK